MRILDVREGHEQDDIRAARAALRTEIALPATTVCILRGSGPQVSQLADRVAGRSDAFPWRQAVWVRSDEILDDDRDHEPSGAEAWFDGDHAGVILDFEDNPAAALHLTDSALTIELAFLAAQQGGDR